MKYIVTFRASVASFLLEFLADFFNQETAVGKLFSIPGTLQKILEIHLNRR